MSQALRQQSHLTVIESGAANTAPEIGGGYAPFSEGLEFTASRFTYKSESRKPMAAGSDDLTSAKIAAAEARTDTKITRLEGRFELIAQTINSKLDGLSGQVSEQRRDRNLVIGTIVVAAIALGALFVAMATYGDALFGRGLNVRDVLQATVKETLEQSKKPEAPVKPPQ